MTGKLILFHSQGNIEIVIENYMDEKSSYSFLPEYINKIFVILEYMIVIESYDKYYISVHPKNLHQISSGGNPIEKSIENVFKLQNVNKLSRILVCITHISPIQSNLVYGKDDGLEYIFIISGIWISPQLTRTKVNIWFSHSNLINTFPVTCLYSSLHIGSCYMMDVKPMKSTEVFRKYLQNNSIPKNCVLLRFSIEKYPLSTVYISCNQNPSLIIPNPSEYLKEQVLYLDENEYTFWKNEIDNLSSITFENSHFISHSITCKIISITKNAKLTKDFYLIVRPIWISDLMEVSSDEIWIFIKNLVNTNGYPIGIHLPNGIINNAIVSFHGLGISKSESTKNVYFNFWKSSSIQYHRIELYVY